MSRATPSSPARALVVLVATVLVATAAALSVGAPSAQAAKPCWERVLDDWVDNGRIDHVYSQACLEQARKHVPEDVRAYTDFEDKIDAAELQATRSLALNRANKMGSKTPAKGTDAATTKPAAREPKVAAGDPGPIPTILNTDTTSADSVPLPLIILASLAMVLLAAGGAGFALRKLQARRVAAGPK